jgi:hypothetical protein
MAPFFYEKIYLLLTTILGTKKHIILQKASPWVFIASEKAFGSNKLRSNMIPHLIIVLVFMGYVVSSSLNASVSPRSFIFSPKGTLYIQGIGPHEITIIRDESDDNFFTPSLSAYSLEIRNPKKAFITYDLTSKPHKRTLQVSKHMKVIFLTEDNLVVAAREVIEEKGNVASKEAKAPNPCCSIA